MKLAALVSGGKDSIYSLFLAKKEHEISVIITMKSENPESYMFHVPGIDLVKLQAESMKIPLIFKTTKGVKEEELEDLKKALKKAKKKYAIEGVVSGAIASKYQKTRIEKICNELGLKSLTPLWGMEPAKLWKDMINIGFEIIIVAVAADGLDESWLGKEITMQRLTELKKLARKYHFNLAGEGGEYETATLDSSAFNKQIKILEMKKNRDFIKIIKTKLMPKGNV